MKRLSFSWISAAGLGLMLLNGCAGRPQPRLNHMAGESVTFIGDTPAALAGSLTSQAKLQVRSTYLPGPDTVNYVEGRDYTVDRAAATIRRMLDSRLPDFRTNILFGKEDFDHSKFPGYGNGGFFAFVDYDFASPARWPVQPPQTEFLRSTREKLKRGDDVTIVAFGDSITEGGEATRPELIFWERWASDLRKKYPHARIKAINGSTGGGTTGLGLGRLQTKVLDHQPDLVLIGYGMNDHNQRGTPIPQFEQNLKELITRIRAQRPSDPAEIILLSAFPPNPRWKFGSHHMEDYAAATGRVAQETRCAYANVFDNWQMLMARKKPEDILGNNINHPNDFGHWIYYRVFGELGL